MTEDELKALWEAEKPIYEAWGGYIVDTITQRLELGGKDLSSFLKVPAKFRLKDDDSLVDKAFYRPGKSYSDPYNQIEDKVGVRFIVLLVEDIEKICEIIRQCDAWDFDESRNFNEEREKAPLLFTYQSVHYVLRPRAKLTIQDVIISTGVSCEVQIRTLLQHAHAELTHDAIYKSKRTVRPSVHRTVAKCMALIETTDQFFGDVTSQLSYGPLEEHDVINRLDGLYLSFTGLHSHAQKSSITIWDEFEQFIDANLVDKVGEFIDKNRFLSGIIKERYCKSHLYQQSVVLFLYWMLKNKKRRLLNDWPFPKELLEPLATDLGVNTFDD